MGEIETCINCKFAYRLSSTRCICENRKSEKWFETVEGDEDCCEEYEEI